MLNAIQLNIEFIGPRYPDFLRDIAVLRRESLDEFNIAVFAGHNNMICALPKELDWYEVIKRAHIDVGSYYSTDASSGESNRNASIRNILCRSDEP